MISYPAVEAAVAKFEQDWLERLAERRLTGRSASS
ncbi:fructose-6-phosphate aldolase [Escherichia coli]|uniref:Fructose-6-phosphate aldolase n=1 Tax=Escherichia coli TaxID=562 RepID=A0A2X3JM68_ECOLX|nr:fructose-6-phosphate aldolase [Escherichia coli]